MTPSDWRVPVDELRRAAKEHVDAVGLRIAADEIGMSFSGLRTFVAGTTPRPSTMRKLRAWCEARGTGAPVTRDDAARHLDPLLEPLPEAEREVVRREFLSSFAAACSRAGIEVAEWARVTEERRGDAGG